MAIKSITNLVLGDDTYSIELPYGTCSTAKDTTTKEVTASSFKLQEEGSRITVKFTNASCANATLKVGSFAAKNIKFGNSATTTRTWKAGDVVSFVFINDTWQIDRMY